MGSTIWKYPIGANSETTVKMPENARVLWADAQYDVPCLWALVDPDAPPSERVFRMFGTGHTVPKSEVLDFIGTLQMSGGQLVFHVFERTGFVKHADATLAALREGGTP